MLQPLPVVIDSAEYYAQVHEITISSIFFDVNKTKLAESGMSFSIFRGKDMNLAIDLSNASAVTKKIFTASVQPTGNNLAVSVDAAISMFESEQLRRSDCPAADCCPFRVQVPHSKLDRIFLSLKRIFPEISYRGFIQQERSLQCGREFGRSVM